MSSYYDSTWSAPGRQPSWEQQAPPRSGASSVAQREESTAFMAQFEEVERAQENLMKSGKFYTPSLAPNRRDSMPIMAPRPYPEYDPRVAGPQRHHSVSEYEGVRPSSSNVQSFYASQRFGPRQNEADQVLQAKRRMAAQRERELRNFHQEQQYQRNMSGAKSDRSMSPSTMTEEERRELIARQHRALYGDNSSLYAGGNNPSSSQDARVATTSAGNRNNSPLAYDPLFAMPSQTPTAEGAVQMPPRDQMVAKDVSAGAQRSRANSTSSPSSNPNTSFSLFENAQQSSRTSTSSPGGSPPRQGGKGAASNPAPIGTRPTAAQGQAAGAALNKRSTTPLPSPLSYGFNASGEQITNNGNDRATPASSNPSTTGTDKAVGLGWGSTSGVWGTSKNNTLGVQASVWG